MLLAAATFTVIWLSTMTWIAFDGNLRGTIYFWVLRHFGKDRLGPLPWSFYWLFGWRTVAMTTLQLGLLACVMLFARSTYQLDSLPSRIVGGVIIALMAVAFALQFYEFHPYFKWRARRHAIRTCRQLSAVVQQFERQSLEEFTDKAAYFTRPDWLARHPQGTGPWWPEVVPVAYIRCDTRLCVAFTCDFETFVAWQLPNDLIKRGEVLPFEGPSGSRFTLVKSHRLRAIPNWTVLRCKPSLDYWLIAVR